MKGPHVCRSVLQWRRQSPDGRDVERCMCGAVRDVLNGEPASPWRGGAYEPVPSWLADRMAADDVPEADRRRGLATAEGGAPFFNSPPPDGFVEVQRDDARGWFESDADYAAFIAPHDAYLWCVETDALFPVAVSAEFQTAASWDGEAAWVRLQQQRVIAKHGAPDAPEIDLRVVVRREVLRALGVL